MGETCSSCDAKNKSLTDEIQMANKLEDDNGDVLDKENDMMEDGK